jgi:hypothetical protein
MTAFRAAFKTSGFSKTSATMSPGGVSAASSADIEMVYTISVATSASSDEIEARAATLNVLAVELEHDSGSPSSAQSLMVPTAAVVASTKTTPVRSLVMLAMVYVPSIPHEPPSAFTIRTASPAL